MSEGNGRTWSPEIKDLGDKLVALTVAKAVELGDYMEEVHKIKPAATAVAVAGWAPATLALLTGVLTWLLLTARHDLTPPP
jgi:large subunit ribosomal protein L7/L12